MVVLVFVADAPEGSDKISQLEVFTSLVLRSNLYKRTKTYTNPAMGESVFSSDELKALKRLLVTKFKTAILVDLKKLTGIGSIEQHFRPDPRPVSEKMGEKYALLLGYQGLQELLNHLRERRGLPVEFGILGDAQKINLAEEQSRIGNYANALMIFEQLATSARSRGDLASAADRYRRAGNQSRKLGNLEGASKLYALGKLLCETPDQSGEIPLESDHARHLIDAEIATLGWFRNRIVKEYERTLKGILASRRVVNRLGSTSTKIERQFAECQKFKGNYRRAEELFKDCKREATKWFNFNGAVLGELGELGTRTLLNGGLEHPEIERLEIARLTTLRRQWIHANSISTRILIDALLVRHHEPRPELFRRIDELFVGYWNVVMDGSIEHLHGQILYGRYMLVRMNYSAAEDVFAKLMNSSVSEDLNVLELEVTLAQFGYAEALRLSSSRLSLASARKAETIYDGLVTRFLRFGCNWGIIRCQEALRLWKSSKTFPLLTCEGLDAKVAEKRSAASNPLFFDSMIL
jgi:hypothetical protein